MACKTQGKFATTFGSSTIKEGEKEYEEGMRLGAFLSENGFSVKCGGYGGLMEAVSKGVHKNGGNCIGVCVEYFEDKRPQNPYISQKIIAKDLIERLRILIEDSELFIIQKGSIGTLNELFLVWCLEYTKMLESARIVLIGKEYEFLKHTGLIPSAEVDRLYFFEDAESFIANFTTLESAR